MRTRSITYGRDPIEKSNEYYYLGLCAFEDGDFSGARRHLLEALEILRDAGAVNTPEYREAASKYEEAGTCRLAVA
ncbi:MAG TPA: hypothetical protein VE621_04005 [Bryobacteraceae bacterium]|nr:hypothetical protein [Bryobacteraceae bacterium]